MDSLQEDQTNWSCERCGTSVSARFVRVFGTDRSVYGCTQCLPSKALYAGAAARPGE
jgi:hypothetical protein